ncbi:Leucine-rich repeat [Ostreococcus tauri]|uniref:Leucine-rich repeat n=1 Tax=Ostreococcus tauri TaxID=70448 RepID=A0A090N3N8_OSTTA|nr:Leucine-rich repeat [Ostreococcus tauri]CEF98443.1 Leucine-rich repeat [Ostreococcus tauri]|eukprot:XP_022839263.1 Leucine-rich repeat [Ostreococcus tauri]
MRARARRCARTVVRVLFFLAVVHARVRGVRASARGASAPAVDIARPLSRGVKAALERPCDAYAKGFEEETAASARGGAAVALERACAAQGGAAATASDACEAYRVVSDGSRGMKREDALRYLRQALHEACQTSAAAMSNPETRGKKEATAFVRDAVSRAAEEEAIAGRASSANWLGWSGVSDVPGGAGGASTDAKARGLWGWERDVPIRVRPEDAFGGSASLDAIRHQEQQALLDIYRRTNGARWCKRDGWDSSDRSYCEWYGVTCQEKDLGVTFINLRDNGLEGDMPQAIDELKMLQGLDLSYNRLEGRLSAMLGELKDLRYLLVRANSLYSDIPPGLFRKGSALTHVDLSGNALSGTLPEKEFGNLASLRMFNASSNALTGTVPNVATLTALEVFSASRNRFRGNVPQFEESSKIKFFDMSENSLSGPVPELLSQLPLVLFDVSHNSLRGKLPEAPFPGTLRVYDVGNNELNGTIPQTFAHLAHLEHLDLAANKFGGKPPFDVLRRRTLKYFNTSWNDFEGELPRNIYQGENERSAMRLETFDVSHNRLSGSLPEGLVELENLRIVDVAHNLLSGDLPKSWTVKHLERLSVKANVFTGSLPSVLAAARRLRYLDLSDNRLSGRVDWAVISLRTLEHMDVSGNRLNWFEGETTSSGKSKTSHRNRAVDSASAEL